MRAVERWESPAMYLTEILGEFEAYQRAADLSENTIRNRTSIITVLARTVPDVVAATVADLRQHVGRPGIAPGSRRTERNAIGAFYAFLVEDGHRHDNPADKLPVVRVPKGEPRPFTPEQIDALLATGAYTRTRAMILLGAYQGFRVSQIAAVHGSDIDVDGRLIRSIGKGGKERAYPLHETIAELAKTMPADDWWFPARGGRGGHIHGASVTNLITRAKKRAGITDPKLTPHSLRHAFGSELVENGIDIIVVAELMGHESVSTTQIYTRVSERRKRDALVTLPSREVPAKSGRAAA